MTIPSLANLEEVLDAAAGGRAVRPNFPSTSPSSGSRAGPTPAGVTLQAQAAYIAIAEQFAYANPRVVSFAQYLLRDDTP